MQLELSGKVAIRISAASARLEFNGCEPDYIKDVCHASCCRNTIVAEGCIVSIHSTEQRAIEARGTQADRVFLILTESENGEQGPGPDAQALYQSDTRNAEFRPVVR
jgi:hypothetical protein